MRNAAVLLIAAALIVGVVIAVVEPRLGEKNTQQARETRRDTPGQQREIEPEEPVDRRLVSAQEAAREFLEEGYLPLIYGQDGASPDQLPNAAPELVARLQADPGRVPPAQAQLEPELERVSVVRDGPYQALATAQIKDDPSSPPYPLSFRLEDTQRGWLVTEISGT